MGPPLSATYTANRGRPTEHPSDGARNPARGSRAVVGGGDEQALCGGCATRVVIDERLGRRLLVDDHESIRAANHVFELSVLVTRDKGEAIVLAPNLLVFGNRHLDPPLAGNVFVASRPALAKKLETFQLSSWLRFFGYPFDPLVYLADQRFVSRLPVKTGFHGR
jgi:hypothetical protein